jgi:alpha-N-arabinofuranosidase
MYKVHQEASLLPMNIKSEIYKHELPSIHASASLDDNGKSHISLCNIDPNNEIGVSIEFSQTDLEHKNCKARILRGDQMNSHNTFESPEIIKPVEFNSANFNVGKNQINFKMPSMAIMVIEID